MKISHLTAVSQTARLKYYNTDVYVTLKHTDSKLLTDIRNDSRGAYSRRRGGSTLDDIDDESMIKAYCERVIIKWENLDGDDGKPLECNLENKLYFMNNSIDFRKWVIEQSGHVPNFAAEPEKVQEENEKKLLGT